MADDHTERRRADGMSLDELREEIAAIDRELVELMAQRTYVAETIARVKAEEGLPTTDETQEERVRERARANADRFDLDPDAIREVFELLIELNKENQRANR
jgi:chorismate mutase